jgi:hypothetical protein
MVIAGSGSAGSTMTPNFGVCTPLRIALILGKDRLYKDLTMNSSYLPYIPYVFSDKVQGG